MAGKNHVEKGFRILFNDGSERDLSGDLIPGTISGMGIDWDNVDLSGVSETVRNGLAGHGTAIVTFRVLSFVTAEADHTRLVRM